MKNQELSLKEIDLKNANEGLKEPDACLLTPWGLSVCICCFGRLASSI
jgi:hypothetical protein